MDTNTKASRKIKILYIDDYELDRELVRDALEREHGGFALTEASNKQEFERFLKQGGFDAVLTDFNIAGYEGLQVLATVRAHDPRIPVIIVTGTGSEEIAARTLKEGASDYIIKKPSHIRKLPQSIFAAIEKKTLRQQREDAENARKESEQRYRAIFDQAADGIFLVDQETGELIDFNTAAHSNLGYTREEFKKLKWHDFEVVESPGEVAAHTREIMEGGSDTFETIHKAQNGELLDILVKNTAISIAGKGYVLSICRDMTIQKRSQTMLSEALLRQKEAVRAGRIGLWDWDLVTDKVEYSTEWKRQIGYEAHELGNDFEEWRSRVHPDDREATMGRVNDFIENPKDDYQVEFRFRHKDGSYRWILALASIFEDENGRPIRMLGSHLDITDRKCSEQAFRDSELEKRLILDAQSNQVNLLDLNLCVIWANRASLESAGLPLEEITGRPCYEIWQNRVQACPDCPVALSVKTGRAQETIKTTADGKIWRLVGNPVRNEAGRIVRAVEVAEDITERESLMAQLRQAQKMEAIGTLAGGIAHDFNNILSSVIGFAELALDDVERGSIVEDSLQEIYSAGKRARELVQQILSISRRGEIEIKPLQVNALVKDVMKMLRAVLPTSIEFRESICNEPLIVNADATQLHQVFVNLVTNAGQSMADENGILEVTVDATALDADIKRKYPELGPGRYARISVSDTGSGIPKEHIDKIFEPYFTTKEKGAGTGLGLSIVHGIVKNHGGHITVNSEPGRGSTFHIYLPLTRMAAVESPHRTARVLPQGVEHVLVVDDELPVVKMQQRSLERLGYKVTARTGSLDALEMFRASPDKFDLIITDLTMPGMTGDKLARAVKAIRPDIPVVLCTGFSHGIGDHEESMDIDGFLMKPVDQEKMAESIREILDRAKKK